MRKKDCSSLKIIVIEDDVPVLFYMT